MEIIIQAFSRLLRQQNIVSTCLAMTNAPLTSATLLWIHRKKLIFLPILVTLHIEGTTLLMAQSGLNGSL